MLYLVVKTLHILSAVLFLGAGMMTAWYKVRADRSGELVVVAWAQREIVRADWFFTVPCGVTLPLTGLWLASVLGQPLWSGWVFVGIACYALAGLLWLPAAWLQLRMRALAQDAVTSNAALPPEFHRANRIWFLLGVPAFAISMAALWVMVAKHAA